MKTNFSDLFTQGGQTQLHKFHMMRQVLGTTIKVGLWIWLIAFIGLILMTYVWQDFWLALCYGKAYCRIVYFKMFPKGFWDSCWLVIRTTDKWKEFGDLAIIRNPTIISFVSTFLASLITKLIQALGIAVASITALIFYWYKRGLRNQKTKVISGSSIVSPRQLAHLLKKQKMNSSLSLGGVPLIKGAETEHTLIVGTTGSGKTNAMNELLFQINQQGGKAVIVDTNGTFVERFFDPSRDILLNPFDLRSESWNLWSECKEIHMFDHFASCLIPPQEDDFWTQGARTAFTVAAMKLKQDDKPTHQKLLKILLTDKLQNAYKYFAGTVAASLMDPSSEKLAQSIRATLTGHIKGLSFVNDDEEKSFSIRKWVMDEEKKGFLFLTTPPDHRATMTPLLTAWFSLAAKALMSEITEQKIWFFVDEMSSLQKLPELSQLLAEMRKYGGCFVLGLQNLSQLDHIYGHHDTRVICGLTGTKLIFRTTDTDTAKRMSAFLGEQEVLEQSESISFGAHQMRDGVNLSPQKKHQGLVLFSDLMKLPNLAAYLRLPRDVPLTLINFDYLVLPTRSLAFIKKENMEDFLYQNINEKSPDPSGDPTPSDAHEIDVPSDTQQKEPPSDPSKAPGESDNPFSHSHDSSKD